MFEYETKCDRTYATKKGDRFLEYADDDNCLRMADVPKKIRELKSMLQKAGFTLLQDRNKGSHTVWEHPSVKQNVILSEKDGRDAQKYQEKRVKSAIEEAKAYE